MRDATPATRLRGAGPVALALFALASVVGAAACGAGAGDLESGSPESRRPGADAGSGGADSGDGDQPPPEQEEEFDFTSPTRVGSSLYIANETLDSLAVVDARNLDIQTIPVGFRPTVVDGPAPDFSTNDAARVMVLNRGSSSVTTIDPADQSTVSRSVLDAGNALEVDPSGRFGVVWHDPARAEEGRAGDFSTVSVVSADASHRVAVGFDVRDVFFDADGDRALVLSEDGVSSIDLEGLDADTQAPPTPLAPESIELGDSPEVRVTDGANLVVARSREFAGLVMLDVQAEAHHVLRLPEVPTDLDLVPGDPTRALVTLRSSGRALEIGLPEAFRAAVNATTDEPTSSDDAGPTGDTSDAGVGDTSMTDDAASDGLDASDGGSTTDASDDTSDVGSTDDADGQADVQDSDATASDAGPTSPDVADAASDGTTVGDAGRDASGDTGDGGPELPTDVDGFEIVELEVDGLGAAAVSEPGDSALFFTTATDSDGDPRRRIVLLDLDDGSQRVVGLQKGVRGAISDASGSNFLVFHTKQSGDIPDDATPSDPEYVARSWGFTLVDVDNGNTNLNLTDHRPGPAALWAPESGSPKIFMIYEPPPLEADAFATTRRDVVEIDLTSFRVETHRLPSVPRGVGPLEPAGKIFVEQRHPRGRMTFLEPSTAERQTITGYQLNSRID